VLSAPVIDDAADVACWRERAERAEGQVTELNVRVLELSEQVAVLSRMLFGRSSEKTRPTPGQGVITWLVTAGLSLVAAKYSNVPATQRCPTGFRQRAPATLSDIHAFTLQAGELSPWRDPF
jgi:hypothetical protein